MLYQYDAIFDHLLYEPKSFESNHQNSKKNRITIIIFYIHKHNFIHRNLKQMSIILYRTKVKTNMFISQNIQLYKKKIYQHRKQKELGLFFLLHQKV